MVKTQRTTLLIFLVLLAVLLTGCDFGPYVIKDWHASSACDGEGVIEWSMQNGKPIITTQGEVQYSFFSAGMPSPWCGGLQHVWIGTVEFEDYKFESDAENPLMFRVDRERGYIYLSGTGTITTPDGASVDLP
jgi:hypothetical protein